MSNTIKTLFVAALVAVSASSAFAATVHRDRASGFDQYNGQLIEGRNAAPQFGYSFGGTSTSRNAMVQELGN